MSDIAPIPNNTPPRWVFEPKDDITNAELAEMFRTMQYSLRNSQMYDTMSDGLKRHFVSKVPTP